MKKLFSTILVICSLLGGNAYAEKKIEFKWSIATSVASKHIYTFYQDGSCDEESHLIIGGCSWVKDGNKVINEIDNFKPNMILLDWMLPKEVGEVKAKIIQQVLFGERLLNDNI